MNDTDLARLADLNYVENLRGMAVTASQGLHRNIQGISVSLTGAPQVAFNVACFGPPEG